jgi:thiamine-phosphate diphosphorylase
LIAPLPPLHLLTDDAVCARAGFAEQAEALMRAGGAELMFHLRAPHASGRRVYALAERLAAAGPLVVNDRLDVALAVGAVGVQLGERSLADADARKLARAPFRIGVSAHGADARVAEADWVLAGTLYETPSHRGRPAAGPELVEALARSGVPVVGVGGITPERVAAVRAAGAAGVAVIRGVWDAPDPVAAVGIFLDAWHNRWTRSTFA